MESAFAPDLLRIDGVLVTVDEISVEGVFDVRRLQSLVVQRLRIGFIICEPEISAVPAAEFVGR